MPQRIKHFSKKHQNALRKSVKCGAARLTGPLHSDWLLTPPLHLWPLLSSSLSSWGPDWASYPPGPEEPCRKRKRCQLGLVISLHGRVWSLRKPFEAFLLVLIWNGQTMYCTLLCLWFLAAMFEQWPQICTCCCILSSFSGRPFNSTSIPYESTHIHSGLIKRFYNNRASTS